MSPAPSLNSSRCVTHFCMDVTPTSSPHASSKHFSIPPKRKINKHTRVSRPEGALRRGEDILHVLPSSASPPAAKSQWTRGSGTGSEARAASCATVNHNGCFRLALGQLLNLAPQFWRQCHIVTGGPPKTNKYTDKSKWRTFGPMK